MGKDLKGSFGPAFSAARFQAGLELVERDVSIATNTTSILQNSPRRLLALLQNRGSVDVYLGFSRQVTSAASLLLTAGGGMLEMTVEEDGEIVGYEVWGIVAAGTGTIHVVEIRGRSNLGGE